MTDIKHTFGPALLTSDVGRTLVDPSKRGRLMQLIEEIGDILDAEGGPGVALIIGGYCNGVYLVTEEEPAHLVFFYNNEVMLAAETGHEIVEEA